MLGANPFHMKVLTGMRREGLTVRRILRVFPAYDTNEPLEVLFIATDGKPGTVFVDHAGEVLHGPVPEFGP